MKREVDMSYVETYQMGVLSGKKLEESIYVNREGK
jgi:hypothetical protein